MIFSGTMMMVKTATIQTARGTQRLSETKFMAINPPAASSNFRRRQSGGRAGKASACASRPLWRGQWARLKFLLWLRKLLPEFHQRFRRQNFVPKIQCRRRPRRKFFRGRRDWERQQNSRWRRRGCVELFPTRRAGSPRIFLFRRDARQSRLDKKGFARLASPSAARLRDTIGPSKSARRFFQIWSATF